MKKRYIYINIKTKEKVYSETQLKDKDLKLVAVVRDTKMKNDEIIQK